MKNMDKAQISEGMTLDNFGLKHDELISNISLESVIMQQDKKKPKLLCKVCKGKIVSQQSEYNDMLGLDVLKVKCENGHDDNIIGFGEDEKEEKQETIEIECAKCGSDTLTPTKIDIYTKDELVVFAACPKNHESNFTIKKK
jgi:Zn finger protein HypA/HybF involved in hydrogenase expression